MEIVKTGDFEKTVVKLPTIAQRLCARQETIFLENWRDVRLHTKKLKGLAYAFSFRITRKYRVLFYFQNPNRAIFFDIDHRKDVYR